MVKIGTGGITVPGSVQKDVWMWHVVGLAVLWKCLQLMILGCFSGPGLCSFNIHLDKVLGHHV